MIHKEINTDAWAARTIDQTPQDDPWGHVIDRDEVVARMVREAETQHIHVVSSPEAQEHVPVHHSSAHAHMYEHSTAPPKRDRENRIRYSLIDAAKKGLKR
jgi:hypothetical protein